MLGNAAVRIQSTYVVAEHVPGSGEDGGAGETCSGRCPLGRLANAGPHVVREHFADVAVSHGQNRAHHLASAFCFENGDRSSGGEMEFIVACEVKLASLTSVNDNHLS